MYKIMRNDRRFSNKSFANYEDARNHVRKWMKKHFSADVRYNDSGNHSGMYLFGFSITRT